MGSTASLGPTVGVTASDGGSLVGEDEKGRGGREAGVHAACGKLGGERRGEGIARRGTEYNAGVQIREMVVHRHTHAHVEVWMCGYVL